MTAPLRWLRTAALTGLICLGLFGGTARCEEQWRADFDAVCAQTGDAMALSLTDLNLLMARCDALEKVIGSQEESIRKVYLKRLQMCRNLYAYVLEYKKNEQSAQGK